MSCLIIPDEDFPSLKLRFKALRFDLFPLFLLVLNTWKPFSPPSNHLRIHRFPRLSNPYPGFLFNFFTFSSLFEIFSKFIFSFLFLHMDSSSGEDQKQIVSNRDVEAVRDQDKGEFSDIEIDKKEDKVKDSKSNHIISPSLSVSESETTVACDRGEKENSSIPSHAPPSKANGHVPPIKLHTNLPQPVPPPQVERSQSVSIIADSMPSIGKYIRERSSSFSAAITRRLASLKEDGDCEDFVVKKDSVNFEVSEFKIPGIKVIVKLKSELEEIKGRVTFFSRSNCRDSTAVRTFLRQKCLRYVEINIDVFPEREKELVELTGKAEVPQIFFNDKFFGGLVALNSLRNSGDLDKRLKEMLGSKCPDDAPALPQYGFDYEEEKTDELAGVVRVLRQVLPIQDRLIKMKVVKNCFTGSEMVEAIINHLDCGRKKAIETGKLLAQKHFIHHVFGENDFEDGKHCYRFLEHEPFIIGCYNYRKCVNDSEPKSAAFVVDRLAKLMFAILESYASENRLHVDYYAISKSEEFRRYLILARDLQRVNLKTLTPDERLAFFLNLYNAMVIHAVVSIGHPEGLLDKRAFYNDFQYVVGGYGYSLSAIENGILRRNMRSPSSWIKPFGNGDRRLELQVPKANPLIHFGLCNGTRSSPTVRFFTPQGVESELRSAAREFFQRGGINVDLDKRTVHLTRIIKWFSVDFGEEKEILKWVLTYLDAAKAGLVTHLLDDGGPINIVYQNYDWCGNTC